MLIDSHAHLDMYPAEELPQVLAASLAAGVTTILAIGIGDDPSTMHRALDIARTSTSPRIFASAGIHPEQAHNATPENLAKLTALAEDPLCIAIGEIGLDYYHLTNPDIPTQQQAFIAQMQIAAAARKPIILHCRTSDLATPEAKKKYAPADAQEDLLTLLATHWQPTGLPGIMHCFSGTPAHAARALSLGFYLSFAGNLTYPKAQQIRDAAAAAPLDRLLIETDAPFLAPIPHRGQQNSPALITHTAQTLADLRNLPLADLAAQTTENFHTLFPTPRPSHTAPRP